MKQIILEIEDSAYEQFMGMIELCAQVNVVSTDEVIDTKSTLDQCVMEAIQHLVKHKALQHAYDHGCILMGINEGWADKHLFFASPQEYIDYMTGLGIEGLPGKSTLYNIIGKTMGRFPNWTFADAPTSFETLRRKNVFQQFLSAFLMRKRSMLE